jgi:hypothetical protein
MKKLVLSLATFLLLFLSSTASFSEEDRGLPVIEEHVDEIYIIYTEGNDYGRVVFIREGNVLATRLLLDEMIWGVSLDSKVQLMWRDYWTAERIVTTDILSTIVLPYDPTQVEQRGQWWCMWRNMRDLKQPE